MKVLNCLSLLALATATTLAAQPASLDPDMKGVLDEFAKLEPKPLETLSAKEARKEPTPADAVKRYLKSHDMKAPKPQVDVDNKDIDGPGGDIDIRVYSPERKSDTPMPVVVYYHGGGFVIADLDVYDATPRALSEALGAVVISSHYRQGPEHKFPAAHEDAFAAYKWTLEHAKKLHGDPMKVAVVGESAGGNLASAVSMMARDAGIQAPVHQVLVYPVVDNEMTTPSYQENANAKPLNKAMMGWFFSNAAEPGDIKDPRLGQLKNGNLKGLPSTTVITAQADPLRSEGEAFAKALESAGVTVAYKNYEGVTHEFFGMAAAVNKAKQAQEFAVMNLKKAFGN